MNTQVITEAIALKEGLEVVESCARWFYSTNASHLKVASIDYEDLFQHLLAGTLVRYYLKIVRENPGVYSQTGSTKPVAKFRASLFESCRRACFAFHRSHIRSQKRGMALLNGVVFLDHQDVQKDAVFKSRRGGSSEFAPRVVGVHRDVAGLLPTLGLKKAWTFLLHGNSQALKRLYPDVTERTSVTATVKKIATNIILYPDMTKFDPEAIKRELAKYTQKGLVQVSPQEDPDYLAVMASVKTVPKERLPELRRLIDRAAAQEGMERSIRFVSHSEKVRDSDYEILSEVFQCEINSEMSLHTIVGVLNQKEQAMSQEDREDVPDYIWDILAGLREVAANSVPKLPSREDVAAVERNEVHVERIDGGFSVCFPDVKTVEALFKEERFTSWLELSEIEVERAVGSPSFTLTGGDLPRVSESFLKTIMGSYCAPLHEKKPSKGSNKTLSKTQCQYIDFLRGREPMLMKDIGDHFRKPVAAVFSTMSSLQKAGLVTSEAEPGRGLLRWRVCDEALKDQPLQDQPN